MYKYSNHSLKQVGKVHPYLRQILNEVLETDDFKVLQGGRTEKEQNQLFIAGFSKLRPPNGKHLIQSDGYCYAVDIVPFINGIQLATDPESFNATKQAQFAWFLRRVQDVGESYLDMIKFNGGDKWKLRLGINWDGDGEILSDQKFDDWFHVELIKE